MGHKREIHCWKRLSKSCAIKMNPNNFNDQMLPSMICLVIMHSLLKTVGTLSLCLTWMNLGNLLPKSVVLVQCLSICKTKIDRCLDRKDVWPGKVKDHLWFLLNQGAGRRAKCFFCFYWKVRKVDRIQRNVWWSGDQEKLNDMSGVLWAERK